MVEFGGIGPGPMGAMLLADLGADVVRIDRVVRGELGIPRPDRFNLLNRGRPSVSINLKHAEGVATALKLVERADAVIEGFRPGTMERLGLGPDVCLARNARLVYARMTGWGQSGPLAAVANHDLNCIALSGALNAIGRKGEAPALPLNLIGDFGGGALYLALGILAAIIEARSSGEGQVVDVSMLDGSASLMTNYYGLHACGQYNDQRGTNITDGGAYYWDVYQCADGLYVSVAAIEAKFRAVLLAGMNVDIEPSQLEEMTNEKARAMLESVFKTKTRSEWCELLEGTDACFAPVLSLDEAPVHSHNEGRGTFIEIDGIVQPAPAPRFSRTKPALPTPPESPGQSTASALSAWGFSQTEISQLGRSGVFGAAFTSAVTKVAEV